ncbi:tetratricopeptide repeat protein [Zobellella aerophila]|uniref:Tetratricopeptide repeat protein 38 n=1 Tax=Zobellella aerophila TaxID=870480 RepID=A0ABP6VFR6_9GAMM
MLTDQQGNPLTGATTEAAALFDQAVTAFNLYRGDPIELLDRAMAAAPGFAMAPIMKAWLFAVATEPQATLYARDLLDHIKTLRLGERESSLLAALELLLAGNWTAAALALDRHCMRLPRDLVALQCGHLLDFYRANARELRDRIARALPHWSPETPGYSILLGMYAFGLEENGDYARAEAAGRQAVAMQPLDCWAHHAVTHVMEMQGRAEDGIGWMMTREPYWSGDDNFFKVHNWWHRALYHLDLDQQDQALALYDGPIRAGHSTMALDMVDATALLWRLQLAGVELGERWQELSEAWDRHADGRLYPFNDWHAAMACLGAGREPELERILQACRAAGRETGEVAAWTRETGLPLIEGFVAFWRGDYPLAAEKLHGARHIANRFGGSHAQRDIIDWTLTEAAVRGGLNDLAQALAHERLALKPHSAVNRRFLSSIITNE